VDQLLKECLSSILTECLDNGFLVTMSTHKDGVPLSDCIILQNSTTQKYVIAMIAFDQNNNKGIAYHGVNLDKWIWSQSEGFTIDDIFESEALYGEVFQFMQRSEIVKYLAK